MPKSKTFLFHVSKKGHAMKPLPHSEHPPILARIGADGDVRLLLKLSGTPLSDLGSYQEDDGHTFVALRAVTACLLTTCSELHVVTIDLERRPDFFPDHTWNSGQPSEAVWQAIEKHLHDNPRHGTVVRRRRDLERV